MTGVSAAVLALVGIFATSPGCHPDPFTPERMAALGTQYPGQTFTAYAWDQSTGCTYSMNPESRQPTASVFKVIGHGRHPPRGAGGWSPRSPRRNAPRSPP